jgi:hypothetical protein
MSSLIHVVYASAASQEFGIESLTELLQQARESNERLGLTGMLLYSAGSFFQVLEGDPGVIDLLLEKLLRDMRHSQVTIIIREPIARRYFESWSMGFLNITQEELANIIGLNDFFGEGSCFNGLDAGRAKKLLAAFAEGRWRTKINVPKPLAA